MAINSILFQVKPAATTLTDTYVGLTGGTTSIGSVICCNQSPLNSAVRVSIAHAGAPDALDQYLFYDVGLCGNETITLDLSIRMNLADVIRVYSDTGNVSFNILGTEI